ncbi:hypothetical protein COEX109129_36585 [Corallococcus exiguus]
MEPGGLGPDLGRGGVDGGRKQGSTTQHQQGEGARDSEEGTASKGSCHAR